MNSTSEVRISSITILFVQINVSSIKKIEDSSKKFEKQSNTSERYCCYYLLFHYYFKYSSNTKVNSLNLAYVLYLSKNTVATTMHGLFVIQDSVSISCDHVIVKLTFACIFCTFVRKHVFIMFGITQLELRQHNYRYIIYPYHIISIIW